jgi:hypothetical protein
MKIEFTLTDDAGRSYIGTAALAEMPRATTRKDSSASRPSPKSKPAKLPEYIVEIRDSGFFKEARIGNEVHATLHGKYPCQIDRVHVALLRLQRKRLLRKTKKLVDGKEQVAYVW